MPGHRMLRLVLAGLTLTLSVTTASADAPQLYDSQNNRYNMRSDSGTSGYYDVSTFSSSPGFTTTFLTSRFTTFTSTDVNIQRIQNANFQTYTTSMGGNAVGRLLDMVSGYGFLTVDGAGYVGGGGASISTCNGRERSFGAEMMGPVEVLRRIYVPNTDDYARLVTILRNKTDDAVSVSVSFSGAMIAAASTTVTATSSGDATADLSDVWMATSGDYTALRAAHVMAGEGGRLGIASIMAPNGGDLQWTYEVGIPANSEIVLLHFVSGQATEADAADKAAELAGLPEGALACLSEPEKAGIVNFAVENQGSNQCLGVGSGGSCDGPEGQCVQPSGSCVDGECVQDLVSDGTPCDDGVPATVDDVCQAGVCTGGGDAPARSNCSATSAGLPGGSSLPIAFILLGTLALIARPRRRGRFS